MLRSFANRGNIFLKRSISHNCFKENVVEDSVPHKPVMVDEVIRYLDPQPNQTIIDMTFGSGGHSKQILAAVPNIKIIALDRDPAAHEYANILREKYPDQVIPLLGRFSELPALLKKINVRQNSIDGFLFDFGCSSMQFDVADRGFSISKNGPLDMRMDSYRYPNQPTAAEILSKIDEYDLARIIKVYGEEKYAKKIAQSIINSRYNMRKLETTQDLVDLIYSAVGDNDSLRLDKLQRPTSVATKTFQAIRIFVNNEMNEINYGMVIASKYLKIGGRAITIAFHSLEDTIVKRHILGNILDDNIANPIPLKYASHTLSFDKERVEQLMNSNWQQLHKHVITPRHNEIEENSRARSAKLRAAARIN